MKTGDPAGNGGDKPVVLFDGACNLCSGWVQFIAKRDPDGYFRFAALQSDKGRELLAPYGMDTDELKTIVLLDGGEAFTQSDAVLGIVRHLGRAWPLLGVLRVVPRFLRDACYGFVARHRYRWFGVKTACELPSDDLKARFV